MPAKKRASNKTRELPETTEAVDKMRIVRPDGYEVESPIHLETVRELERVEKGSDPEKLWRRMEIEHDVRATMNLSDDAALFRRAMDELEALE